MASRRRSMTDYFWSNAARVRFVENAVFWAALCMLITTTIVVQSGVSSVLIAIFALLGAIAYLAFFNPVLIISKTLRLLDMAGLYRNVNVGDPNESSENS